MYTQTCMYTCKHTHLAAHVRVSAGQRAGVVFADMLTQLFEEVAGVVDKYYPVVHSCYGSSYVLHFIHQMQVRSGCVHRWRWVGTKVGYCC